MDGSGEGKEGGGQWWILLIAIVIPPTLQKMATSIKSLMIPALCHGGGGGGCGGWECGAVLRSRGEIMEWAMKRKRQRMGKEDSVGKTGGGEAEWGLVKKETATWCSFPYSSASYWKQPPCPRHTHILSVMSLTPARAWHQWTFMPRTGMRVAHSFTHASRKQWSAVWDMQVQSLSFWFIYLLWFYFAVFS